VTVTATDLSGLEYSIFRGTVFPFGVVLFSGGVVLVLLERVPGVENVFVGEHDRGEVLDAEIDPCHAVVRRVVRFEFDFADKVQLPFLTVPDRSNILHLVDFRKVNVRAGLVLAEES